jgi:signal transduction histidine kinase
MRQDWVCQRAGIPPRGIAWVDVALVVFIGLNLVAMRLFAVWQTIPFLAIWVSLTAIYGFRLWRLGSTVFTVAVLTAATGGLIGLQVLRGQQDADYLAEVPLLAIMFMIMVWHSRRRLVAKEEMERVSRHNLALVERQRQLIQDVSHQLGTPITIALGHAELIKDAATDHAIARDAGVAVEELLRMRRLANRLLLLASADSPDFLRMAPVNVAELLMEALHRWSHAPRQWSVGTLAEASVLADSDRLSMALDVLIENAVDYTGHGGHISLSAYPEGRHVVLAVADSGPGIPESQFGRIFDRFAQAGQGQGGASRRSGLGLPVAKAIAEAHHGFVRVQSTVGKGSTFELHLPAQAGSGNQGPGADQAAVPG